MIGKQKLVSMTWQFENAHPVFEIILILIAIVMTKKDFERTYDATWRKLYNIAYSFLQDSNTAQQVTEDVYVNLWMNRDSLPPILDLQAYLLRSLKNKIYNQLDKSQSRQPLERKVTPMVTRLTDNIEEQIAYIDTLSVANQGIDQ